MPVVAGGLVLLFRSGYLALHAHTAFAVVLVVSERGLRGEAPWGVWSLAVICMLVTGYFRLPDLRAPYLAKKKRGFRAHPRVQVDLPVVVTINGWQRPGFFVDLSIGGAYIAMSTERLTGNEVILVEGQMRGEVLHCPARVVSRNAIGELGKPEGVGIAFTCVSPESLATLERIITNGRRHKRLRIGLPVTIEHDGKTHEFKTLDLSEGGCFVSCATNRPGKGAHILVGLELRASQTIHCPGRVVWVNEASHDGGRSGFAVQFDKLSEGVRTQLKARLVEADAQAQKIEVAATDAQARAS